MRELLLFGAIGKHGPNLIVALKDDVTVVGRP